MKGSLSFPKSLPLDNIAMCMPVREDEWKNGVVLIPEHGLFGFSRSGAGTVWLPPTFPVGPSRCLF